MQARGGGGRTGDRDGTAALRLRVLGREFPVAKSCMDWSYAERGSMLTQPWVLEGSSGVDGGRRWKGAEWPLQ
jgi:hypothetical protein